MQILLKLLKNTYLKEVWHIISSISYQIHWSHEDTKNFSNCQQIGLLFKVTTRISNGQKDYKEAHDIDSSMLT